MINKYSHSLPYYIIFFTIIFHLIFINLSPINFENSFSEGAKYLNDYNIKIIDSFFEHNANTFVFSLISSIFHKILPFIDTLYITKFISLLGYLFLGIGIINIHKLFNLNINLSLLILIIFFNPIIWTYGYRGTPDFISSSLAFFSLSYLLNEKNEIKKIFLYSLIFGLSVAIKPHAILVFIFFLIFNFYQLRFGKSLLLHIRKLCIVSILVLVPSIIYNIIIYFVFDIVFVNDEYKNMHIRDHNNLSESMFYYDKFFQNFILYVSFLILSIIPIYILQLFYNFKSRKFFYYTCTFLILLIFLDKYVSYSMIGEMDFGFLSFFISNSFFKILINSCFIIFLLILFEFFINNTKNKDLNNLLILIFIVLFLVVLSFFRPAQRYLLLILPFFTIFFCSINLIKIKYTIVYFISFFFINSLILSNHVATSITSDKIVEYLINEKIIYKTHPGLLNAHSRHLFFEKSYNQKSSIDLYNDKERIYIIESFSKNNSLICYSSNFVKILSKNYCVNKLIK